MSIVVADTDVPVEKIIERRSSPRDYTGIEKAYYKHGGYPLCGCCGGKVVTTIEQFNSLNVGNPMSDNAWNYEYFTTINRGVLLMLNPPQEKIVHSEDFPVELVQCGDDVLAIRLRKKQVFA